MRTFFIRSFLFVFLTLFSVISFAWDHSIEFGFGQSHDPNHTKYTNSGFLLSGDIYPLRRTPSTFWSIAGYLGRFNTTTPINKNVSTAAISLALRYYPFVLQNNSPYLLASAGPAYISSIRFGFNTQASHATIQTNLGLGDEINQFDMNLRLEHFSNAGLGKPNQGFNVLYLASLGYLF